jgi:hypothetical protein
MRKFYKFTKTSAEDRRKELFDFVTKYNKKYASYSSVISWINTLPSSYFDDEEGFEFSDEDTTGDSSMWGHGGLRIYNSNQHIIVNDNINLGQL